ncbi:LysM peptidoglycan-binding domain-containing protein [Spongiimicrobium salis]|uniref:LysM peptidoglycan-binding domain-containing protein n=1 Tax=Spongiimicrobium salis TaxID=1667022 RepID=UPI00374CB08E
MSRVPKIFIVTLVISMLSCSVAIGQQYKTHKVKNGETLEGIARQYNLSVDNILTYNKELKKGDSLRPNTILVIPSATGAADSSAEKEDQEEPVGFGKHRVRKRETLYSITQRYKISEAELKRYNSKLYASRLKRGMVLKIPKYKRVKKAEHTINEEDYETYIVKAKETRWSIAHTRNITMDSLLALNPQLSKLNSDLAEGAELKLPKIAGSSVENTETQLYTSYTVPPKIGFYRLEKEFGVTADELMKLNPEIVERGGLKEGMVLRIPQKKTDFGAINTDNYIFYQVKPKQNEFRLTRKFGMTYEEILALNPAIKDGFKAGMILKIPKDQVGDFEVKDALILDRINLLDSIDVANRPKLVFMLPFRLDKINTANRKATQKLIENRNDIKISLGLYTGALVAIDSIAKLGISVDVTTFDTEKNAAKTREILSNTDLRNVSAIFGPLDSKFLPEVAQMAANYQIPVITPLASKSSANLRNVFFPITDTQVLREKMLNYIAEHRTSENIIVIADKENKEVASLIKQKFPDAKLIELIEEEKNIAIDRDKFELLLSEQNENWVFVETMKSNIVSSISSILNSSNTEEIKVRMLTTNKNRAFEDNNAVSTSHLSNLNFSYPSPYREVGNDGFVKRYTARFGSEPDKYAIRGFDITYDLLLKLAYKNNLFEASQTIGETEYTGHKFQYSKEFNAGYFNKASYIMKFEEMHIKEIK